MVACLFAALLATADMAVEIAPDQPVPHVYGDEPLVLELKASAPTTAGVTVSLSRPDSEAIVLDAGRIQLREDAPLWIPLSPPRLPRGNYEASITVDVGGDVTTYQDEFCVIERPDGAAGAPAIADLTSDSFETVLAFADVPVRVARIPATHPAFDTLVKACKATGLAVGLVLPGNRDASGGAGEGEEGAAASSQYETRAESLARDHGSMVAYWEVPGGEPERLLRTATAVRRGGSRAPVIAGVASTDELDTLLRQGAGRLIAGVGILTDGPGLESLRAFRTAAERHGYEHLPLHYLGPLVHDEMELGDVEALRQLVLVRASLGTNAVFPGDLTYAEGRLQPTYVYLSGMAHRLGKAVYVGTLEIDRPAAAYVFRMGATWLVVAWSDEPMPATLDVGAAENLVLTDGCNNGLPVVAEEGHVQLSLGPVPVYLSGEGGGILGRAAAAAAALEAESLLEWISREDSALTVHRATVEALAQGNAESLDRLQFVGLLQGFPDLERQWHAGEIGRADAVPTMAALARLVRLLCILEQERGEEFVESLQNVIARCGEFQSVYLMGTGANGPDHERGDWLLEEVNRLVDEAERLRDAGRSIEAVGVASMAEARARALEFAAAAKPLSQPESQTPPVAADDDRSSKAS